ncbi:MAG: methylated-DNA--[protein]-cysteine S-methyltransferase [Aquabacterium sp.]|nr:methylated-DNA--[protein]-cysteine S-methyltransferase [Aquabacterium sp.]
MTHHPDLQAQARIPTPLGTMTAAASATGLAGLWFDGQAHHPGTLAVATDPQHPHLQAAARALQACFDGAADPLAGVPLDLRGTAFQQAVWRALIALPRGATSTYGQIASAAGSPGAVRAAGAAIGRNPVSVLVPCHRVLGRDGSLTGYAGGLHRKTALLQAEGVQLTAGLRLAPGLAPALVQGVLQT